MIQFERAFLQKVGNNKLRIEETLVSEYLKSKGIPIVFYTEKEINRRRLPIDENSLVVGNMPCMFGAIKQLGLDIPLSNPYPKSLEGYLHRKVWQDTLSSLEHKLYDGLIDPVFAKPKSQHKKFTGRVFTSVNDLYFVYGVTRRLELICSDVVEWISEFRVYVIDSNVRTISHYSGDPGVYPSEKVMRSAVEELDKAGESFSGFAIDFGVLSTGETALIEMNDGFALGAYDVSAMDYGELVCKRWQEIVSNRNEDIKIV